MSVSRREIVVLACFSLLTILGIGLFEELLTRQLWAEEEHNPCFVLTPRGRRPQPGCVARIKNAEGPWVTMQYNNCGFRSTHPCGPKPPGTRRIVVTGTSIAEGLFVPYDDHFSARLERDLSARCGGPVEVQNVASLERPARSQRRLVPQLLALQPDAVVMVFAPYDLLDFVNRPKQKAPDSARVTAPRALPAPQTFKNRLRMISRDSRALLIAQHFMLRDQDALLRAYVVGNEDDVLRVPLSQSYQERYAVFEQEMTAFADTLRQNGVPFVFGAVPNRIQAALVSNHLSLPNVDPTAYDRAAHALGERSGFLVADMMEEFASSPHAERLFYVVDGHPNGGANAHIAAALERTLTSGAIPAFAGCRPRT